MENKRKIGLNIIDYILIIAFVCLAVYVFYHIRGFSLVSGKDRITETGYEITLEFSPLREEFRSCISVGDAVFDAETGKQIGEISKVNYTDCVHTSVNLSTGEKVNNTYPGYVTLTVTMNSDVKVRDGLASANGTKLLNGNIIHLRTPGFEGNGKIVLISGTVETK